LDAAIDRAWSWVSPCKGERYFIGTGMDHASFVQTPIRRVDAIAPHLTPRVNSGVANKLTKATKISHKNDICRV
jgi:hypothetical protein